MRAVLVVGVLLVPALGVADKGRADKLFEEGRGYLQRKEYALACTAFEQSHQAEPAIGTQMNIALCYEQWGKLASSYRAYVEAERLAKAKKDDRAKHARKKIDEIEPKLARLRVAIPPSADPYAIYLFDDKEIEREDLVEERLLDAGKHTVEVRVAGSPPKLTTLTLQPGERKSVTPDMPAAPVVAKPGGPAPVDQPRDKRKFYGGIGLISGGGVALGIASFVALVARSDYNDAIAMCPSNVCQTRAAYDATQDAITRANWMTAVSVAGLAMVGVGVYFVLTSKPKETVTAAPLVAPNTVGVAIGGPL